MFLLLLLLLLHSSLGGGGVAPTTTTTPKATTKAPVTTTTTKTVNLCASKTCNDNDPCTVDSCNPTTGQCNYALTSNCCSCHTDCGTPIDACHTPTCSFANHVKRGGGSTCDVTKKGTCSQVAVPGCCLRNIDCKPTDPCMTATCNLATHHCTPPAPVVCPGNSSNACQVPVCQPTQAGFYTCGFFVIPDNQCPGACCGAICDAGFAMTCEDDITLLGCHERNGTAFYPGIECEVAQCPVLTHAHTTTTTHAPPPPPTTTPSPCTATTCPVDDSNGLRCSRAGVCKDGYCHFGGVNGTSCALDLTTCHAKRWSSNGVPCVCPNCMCSSSTSGDYAKTCSSSTTSTTTSTTTGLRAFF